MTEDRRIGSNPLFTRRETLGLAGQAALAGIAAGTVSHAAEKRPRLACVVTGERTRRSSPCWAGPGPILNTTPRTHSSTGLSR